MELQIGNKIITAPIISILKHIHSECGGNYLNYIGQEKGDTIMIQCPFHKEGQEKHPSCSVYIKRDNPNIYYGTVHCFTCGKKVPFYTLVGKCFDRDDEFGKEWLLDNYGDTIVSSEEILPEITFEKKQKVKILDESILNEYSSKCDYLNNRGISQEILDLFHIKYDPKSRTVVFPVWDEHNNLSFLTRRSVDTKRFFIDDQAQKPVYLYNFVKQWAIDSVFIVESQINCLTLWTWHYPALALFGTGSKHQYEILKKSGIRNYCLAFDGDDAGRKGARRFIENMPQDILISVALLPEGKDINDLSFDEFLNLKFIDKNDFLVDFC